MADETTEKSTKGDQASDAAVLDDDKPSTVKEFEGATLQIGSSEDVVNPGNDVAEIRISQPSVGSSLSRNRPGSVIGRTSVRSTTSRTSMRPGHVQTEMSARSFYCYKVGKDSSLTPCFATQGMWC